MMTDQHVTAELDVIKKAQKGDAFAFGEIYDAYYGRIYGFVLNRLKHVETAKDITSEIFFQVVKNLSKYQYKKGKSFKSWLFSIAVAQVNNYFRKRSKLLQTTLDECPEILAPEQTQADYQLVEKEKNKELGDLISKLQNHVASLNEKHQTIISLRYYSHLTIPEIAQIMNMKEGTIKSHIHRAIKKLQVLMNEEGQTKKEIIYETNYAYKYRRTTS